MRHTGGATSGLRELVAALRRALGPAPGSDDEPRPEPKAPAEPPPPYVPKNQERGPPRLRELFGAPGRLGAPAALNLPAAHSPRGTAAARERERPAACDAATATTPQSPGAAPCPAAPAPPTAAPAPPPAPGGALEAAALQLLLQQNIALQRMLIEGRPPPRAEAQPAQPPPPAQAVTPPPSGLQAQRGAGTPLTASSAAPRRAAEAPASTPQAQGVAPATPASWVPLHSPPRPRKQQQQPEQAALAGARLSADQPKPAASLSAAAASVTASRRLLAGSQLAPDTPLSGTSGQRERREVTLTRAPGAPGWGVGITCDKARIVYVTPGSAAYRAGLSAGDILSHVDGRPVGPATAAAALAAAPDSYAVGVRSSQQQLQASGLSADPFLAPAEGGRGQRHISAFPAEEAEGGATHRRRLLRAFVSAAFLFPHFLRAHLKEARALRAEFATGVGEIFERAMRDVGTAVRRAAVVPLTAARVAKSIDWHHNEPRCWGFGGASQEQLALRRTRARAMVRGLLESLGGMVHTRGVDADHSRRCHHVARFLQSLAHTRPSFPEGYLSPWERACLGWDAGICAAEAVEQRLMLIITCVVVRVLVFQILLPADEDQGAATAVGRNLRIVGSLLVLAVSRLFAGEYGLPDPAPPRRRSSGSSHAAAHRRSSGSARSGSTAAPPRDYLSALPAGQRARLLSPGELAAYDADLGVEVDAWAGVIDTWAREALAAAEAARPSEQADPASPSGGGGGAAAAALLAAAASRQPSRQQSAGGGSAPGRRRRPWDGDDPGWLLINPAFHLSHRRDFSADVDEVRRTLEAAYPEVLTRDAAKRGAAHTGWFLGRMLQGALQGQRQELLRLQHAEPPALLLSAPSAGSLSTPRLPPQPTGTSAPQLVAPHPSAQDRSRRQDAARRMRDNYRRSICQIVQAGDEDEEDGTATTGVISPAGGRWFGRRSTAVFSSGEGAGSPFAAGRGAVWFSNRRS
eukprot:TRINITY_DN13233_c0_g1_i1.p1 TRINITY_DN13233_c0_g1~~TRINITY_DN13233_c0_g1_i1.p1  ORF type:complete len:976 (+),score=227.12 TRINITY_DN13233_c0_g1_i1:118-3045(+)